MPETRYMRSDSSEISGFKKLEINNTDSTLTISVYGVGTCYIGVRVRKRDSGGNFQVLADWSETQIAGQTSTLHTVTSSQISRNKLNSGDRIVVDVRVRVGTETNTQSFITEQLTANKFVYGKMQCKLWCYYIDWGNGEYEAVFEYGSSTKNSRVENFIVDSATSGFNMFLNAVDVTPSTAGSWQDVDISAYVSNQATGAILKIVNTTSSNYRGEVRKKGSTDDFGLAIHNGYTRHVFVGVDVNFKFQAYIGNAGVKIYLIGWCDEAVGFFTNGIDKTPASAPTDWTDMDLSNDIPEGSSGVIFLLYNAHSSTVYWGGVRVNGTNDCTSGKILANKRFVYQLCGVDANRLIEYYEDNTNIKLMLVGYTKSPVTFFVNRYDKSLSQTSTWVDVDVTSETDVAADCAIFAFENKSTTLPYNCDIRKNGSTDDHTSKGGIYINEYRCGAVGMDSDQIFEAWISNTYVDTYLIGYCKPAAGEILKEVADSTGLSDALLCNKNLSISDFVGIEGASLKHWVPQILDSVGVADIALTHRLLPISEQMSLVEAILSDKQFSITDSIALSDLTFALKMLVITETIALSEAIELTTGAIIKYVTDILNLTETALVNKTLIASETLNLMDEVFRHKPNISIQEAITLTEIIAAAKILLVKDSTTLSDIVPVLKQLHIKDSIALQDQTSTPTRILQTLDGLRLVDNTYIARV